MRAIACILAVSLVLSACTEETYVSPTGSAAKDFSVGSDPQARYVMLDVTRHSEDRILTLSRRSARSGVIYTRRLIDCGSWMLVTLGSGSTLSDMRRSRPDRALVAVVPLSIADVTATVGCQEIGMSRTS